jgi:hypothetical protein
MRPLRYFKSRTLHGHNYIYFMRMLGLLQSTLKVLILVTHEARRNRDT